MSTTTQQLLNLANNPYQKADVKTQANLSLEAKALTVFTRK